MNCSLRVKLALQIPLLCAGLFAGQRAALAQQSAIPLWQYSVVGPSNNINTIGQKETYKGSIVGTDPFNAHLVSTTVPIVLIPVRLTFPARPAPYPGGFPVPKVVFDPTAVSCVDNRTPVSIAQKSPVFNDTEYVINGVNVGNTQYVDAFQRASFWERVHGSDYHLLFRLETLPVIDVTVPIAQGDAAWAGCFNNHSLNLGSMRQAWFDGYVRTVLLPRLTEKGVVKPSVLPIFYLDTVTMTLDNDPAAASYSYHSGVETRNGPQFYSVVTFNADGTTPPSSSVPAPDQPLSDELVNWVNNPYSSNQSPAWGWVGDSLGCWGYYAPSWPLSIAFNYSLPLNDYSYTTTELSFFSWFYDQSPSLAAGGLYSDHGALRRPASAQGCTFADNVESVLPAAGPVHPQ
jgi:hypothetical protein